MVSALLTRFLDGLSGKVGGIDVDGVAVENGLERPGTVSLNVNKKVITDRR
jgi:hypothetical protein